MFYFNCYKCWFSLYKLNYNSGYVYISSKNKPIKQLYDNILSPSQILLIKMY